MTTVDRSLDLAVPQTADRAETMPPPRRRLRETWWRHVIAIVAIAFSLFPMLYIASAAFNADQSLSASSLIPRDVTIENFRELLSGETTSAGGQSLEVPYLRWFANSLIVASAAALLTVMLGALAAYAFSRFRFKGRRLGMMALLLIQMFPVFLAIVAIYLILLNTGDVFSFLGLNTLTGLILVYLGGAMGVNAWLMKGFFDTIPPELDESARVDGATPAQIFWGVVLPLAAPVLAVVALISFITTLNEFLIAGTLLQTSERQTLPVGMQFFVDQKYAEEWGPFAAGVLLAAIPVVILFMALQKFIVQGLTRGAVKG